MGAVLRVESCAGRLSGLRETHRPQDLRSCYVVRLREFDGQSYFLHDIQQSIQAGVQEGVALPVQKSNLETNEVGRVQASRARCHQGLTTLVRAAEKLCEIIFQMPTRSMNSGEGMNNGIMFVLCRRKP